MELLLEGMGLDAVYGHSAKVFVKRSFSLTEIRMASKGHCVIGARAR